MASTGEIFLVRHGETVFNFEGRYQGQSDSPLTDNGRNQAAALGRRVAALTGGAPVLVRTSPLGRARTTAELMAVELPDARIVEDPRLMEVGMGAWDGLTRAEIKQRWPDARKGRNGRRWMFHGPGGEGVESVLSRLQAVLAEVRGAGAGATVLVSHAVSGRLLRSLHAGIPVERALLLEAPQNVVFRLAAGGAVDRIAA